MDESGTTSAKRRTCCAVAVRIALALTALTPVVAPGTDRTHEQLAPAPSARATVLGPSEPSREAAGWAQVRRHLAHL